MTAVTTRDALARALHETRDFRDHFPSSDVCRYCYNDADRIVASGAVVDVTALADDFDLVEAARKAIEDELIDWRDERRFMVCGNGFTIREKDGEPSTIIRFRTDLGLRIGLRAIAAALTERVS